MSMRVPLAKGGHAGRMVWSSNGQMAGRDLSLRNEGGTNNRRLGITQGDNAEGSVGAAFQDGENIAYIFRLARGKCSGLLVCFRVCLEERF